MRGEPDCLDPEGPSRLPSKAWFFNSQLIQKDIATLASELVAAGDSYPEDSVLPSKVRASTAVCRHSTLNLSIIKMEGTN
jgi:hypothetical protein